MNTLWGKFVLSAINGFCSPGIKTIVLIAGVIQVGEIEGRVYSAWPPTVCASMAVRQKNQKVSLHSLKCNSYCSNFSAVKGHPSSCYRSSFACQSFSWLCFVSYIFHKMTFDSSSMPQSSYFSHRWRLSLYTDERGGAPLIGHFLRCALGK